jgi:uncharacterized membrane protein (DUF2068 family)
MFLIAILLLLSGVLQLVFGIGAWSLKRWAWTLGIVVQVASIILNVVQVVALGSDVSSIIVNVVISAIIIYYLYRPHVKTAFGVS